LTTYRRQIQNFPLQGNRTHPILYLLVAWISQEYIANINLEDHSKNPLLHASLIVVIICPRNVLRTERNNTINYVFYNYLNNKPTIKKISTNFQKYQHFRCLCLL